MEVADEMTPRKVVPKKSAKKTAKRPTPLGLLKRLVEQGDESYAQQGRTLALLLRIKEAITGMTEQFDRLNAKNAEIVAQLESESAEIQQAIANAGQSGLTAEELTTLEAQGEALKTAIAALVTVTTTPPEEPTE